jgi:hypothetical protein
MSTENEMQVITDSETLSLINRAEIDMQISTAKKFPRSIKTFLNESLELATLNEKIAEECAYALPRKENGKVKMIEGPSARFGEIVASAWGNCRAGARVVAEDGQFVTAQGIFHDLEKNVAITYEVRRRITGKSGQKFSADMVAVTGNAACSIALRNAILKGVPKAFWIGPYEESRKTAMGNAKTLVSRRGDAIGYFKKFGVTEEQICGVLEVKGIDDIGLEELATLTAIKNAIKEGDTTVEQAFNPHKAEDKRDEVVNRFTKAETVNPTTGEIPITPEEKTEAETTTLPNVDVDDDWPEPPAAVEPCPECGEVGGHAMSCPNAEPPEGE